MMNLKQGRSEVNGPARPMAVVRTSRTKGAGACIPDMHCSQEGEVSEM